MRILGYCYTPFRYLQNVIDMKLVCRNILTNMTLIYVCCGVMLLYVCDVKELVGGCRSYGVGSTLSTGYGLGMERMGAMLTQE